MGAQNYLQRATENPRSMVTEYGGRGEVSQEGKVLPSQVIEVELEREA